MLGRAVPLGRALDFSSPGEGAERVPERVTNLPAESFARAANLSCGGKRLPQGSLPCKRTLRSPVGLPDVCGCPRKLSTSYYGRCW